MLVFLRWDVVHTDLKVGSHVPAQSLGCTIVLESVVCIIYLCWTVCYVWSIADSQPDANVLVMWSPSLGGVGMGGVDVCVCAMESGGEQSSSVSDFERANLLLLLLLDVCLLMGRGV